MTIGNPGSVGPGWQSAGFHNAGLHAALGGHDEPRHGVAGGDPVDAYFECITSCSLDDGECVTTCTAILRETS
jgi:hypothetical protein